MQRDYTYEIALTMLPKVGSRTARQMLDIVDSAETLFKMKTTELHHLLGNHNEIIEAVKDGMILEKAKREMDFVENNKINIHYYKEPGFPKRLNLPGCVDTPVLLYSIGKADMNPERAISVVGTRKATVYGRDMAKLLIDGLRNEGITVVSGLALGIDGAAHAAALANGLPTIGVLAHGLNQLYPPSNRNLAKQMIANGGSLLTEMHSGTKLSPGLFPTRNRIIAAMSDATVVIEASKTGGALITANIANGYNRDIFAFPGRIEDKYSEGCNAIIAACKAMLIRNADDLMDNMGWERRSKRENIQTTIFPELNRDETIIYNIIASHPSIGIEEISSHCDLSLPKIASALLTLELKNVCRCLPGKIYKIL